MATVVLNWNRKTVPEKIIKARFIIDQMTLNATTFPTPNPSLADASLANDNLASAATAAEAGGYALTYAKNEAEKVLDDLMRQLKAYVQNTSGGDAGIILQSGMELKKVPSPLPDPMQAQNLDAYPTRTQGQIQLDWDKLDNAIGYQVEMWIEDDAGEGFWDRLAISTKSKYTAKNLETGTVYRFRVAGVGKDDALGAFSQEASSVAP